MVKHLICGRYGCDNVRADASVFDAICVGSTALPEIGGETELKISLHGMIKCTRALFRALFYVGLSYSVRALNSGTNHE